MKVAATLLTGHGEHRAAAWLAAIAAAQPSPARPAPARGSGL
jgi:hypothetical protein